MRIIFAVFTAFLSTDALAETASDEKALLTFISDASTFEGQFYSIHDYCGPLVGEPVATLAKTAWTSANKALLAARDEAVEIFITAHDLEAEAATKIRMTAQGITEKARHDNRMYKDIVNTPDKQTACGKRLGAMNSNSMSFQSIAPDSYAFWKRQTQ